MTARRRPRLRRRLRPLVKWLLGAFLALIGVLAPIEPPGLPEPLHLVGAPTASAQTTVITGTPDACPEDPIDTRNWQVDTNDASLCELRDLACAEHPLQSGTYLTPSTQYPDFCEAPPILEAVDATMYQDCEVLTGYAIEIITRPTGRECRMIQPARCASGLHRVGFNTCLRVQRRTWECPSGTFPRNQFNSCYRPPAGYTPPHPACATGAPAFAIVTCEEYVGEDFARNAATLACGSSSIFPTGDPLSALADHAANPYWCRYNTAFFDVGCHATGATCAASYAYCIKRASRTGGCDVVADTIRCRGLQADYLDSTLTVSAGDVYRQGCTPCVVLPFEGMPSECPSELRDEPSRVGQYHPSRDRYEWAHTYKADFEATHFSCAVSLHETGAMPSTCPDPIPACADPPRGRLDWQSNHHSALAVVNSPVMLRVGDTLSQTRTVHWVGNSRRRGQVLYLDSGLWYEYPGSNPGDPIVRTWHQEDASSTYGSVGDIARGECLARDLPKFQVLVEELWPDNDAAAIEDLFGRDSLNWWTPLNQQERRRYTEARGLEYTVGLSPMQLADELDERARVLTDEIPCNFGRDVWCRWTPVRPGYYRLTAAGGWSLRSFHGTKHWLQSHHIQTFNDYLMNDFNAGDGDCDSGGRFFAQGRDYDCVMAHLSLMGMTPAQIGLVHDQLNRTFTGLLPLTLQQDNEWLYSAAAGENYRCPARDVRVLCGASGEAVNYTETEPVGIVVHEVRVSTVMPDN